MQIEISKKMHSFSGLLETYCSKALKSSSIPSESEIAIQDWAASHFVFRLLKNIESAPVPTLEALEASQNSFSKEVGVTINTQSLLDRHWVRIIGGEIRIAKQIQYQFKYLEDYGKDRPKPGFWEKHKFEFQFLHQFTEEFSVERNGSTIQKSQFREIADKHRLVFPKMPEINGLLNLDWFSEKPENIIAIQFHSNLQYRSLANQVAVLVWKDILEEELLRNDIELIEQWERMVLRNGLYPFGFLLELSSSARQRFEAGVLQRIKLEQDLLEPESEILKSSLDYDHYNQSISFPNQMPNFPLKGVGVFDSFMEINRWNLYLHTFDYQHIRSPLFLFIREILIVEKSSQTDIWSDRYLKIANKLLRTSENRPALLYTFCELVKKDYPEILTVFFKSADHLSLGCYLVQYAPIRREVLPESKGEQYLRQQEIRSLLFTSAFEVSLGKLAIQQDARKAGKSVCEMLGILAQWMFHEKNHENAGNATANELHQRYQSAWRILSSPQSRMDFWFLNTPTGFYDFTIGFIERLTNQPELPVANNYKELNLPFLSLLSSLFQLVQSCRRIFTNNNSINSLEQQIRKLFIQTYCGEFKVSEVKVLNLKKNRLGNPNIKWFSEPDNLDFFEFEPLFYAKRAEISKLLNAVTPQYFELDQKDTVGLGSTEGEEDSFWVLKPEDKKRSEKIKCRVHFRFLLRFYQAFESKTLKAKLGQSKWEGAEKQIREKLLDWAVFNRDDAEAELFDIYDASLENFYTSISPLPHLILDVIQTVNLFPKEENRLEFIKHLTDGITRLDLLLKIHNTVFDYSCKKYIQEVIDRIDIQTFTDNQYLWKPIETALIEATNEESFLQIAEKLLDFVKKRGNRKSSIFGYGHTNFIFEIQLILAYRKNDRNALKLAADEYKENTRGADQNYIQKRLQLFEGFFLMFENRLEEAAKIWRHLSGSDTSIDIHYRKYYCEVQSAIKEIGDPKRGERISNAYEDWRRYETEERGKEDFGRFWDGILFCKMAWLHIVHADAEFDFHKSQLSQNGLYDVEVLSLIFENYARREMHEQAGHLFLEAKKHFVKHNEQKLKSLDQLANQFSWEPILNSMKSALGYLNEAPVEDLVRLVPNVFNPYNTVSEFLLYEFQFAAQELLDKVTSIGSIRSENRYNDLFTVLLRARLSFLRFEIGDQPREGKSSTGKDAGELDMTVRYGSRKLATYEAFIYRNRLRTEQHLVKVFDYSPTCKIFFSVVIFKGEDEKFETKFVEYQKFLIGTPFPKRYSLKSSLEAVQGFPRLNNLLVGKTLHGESKTVMYHLFINFAFGK